jgi:glycosyltransferase involved in cell wall biosynthesis
MSNPVDPSRISIITPVRNAARFIRKAIDSVQQQGYDAYELVIMDCNSTDGTSEIIKDYAENDARIVHIREADAGQSDALNKAIARTTGNIISSLNADDYYHPGAFERIAREFTVGPNPLIVIGDIQVTDEHDQPKSIVVPTDFTAPKIMAGGKRFPINPVSYFWHRSIHDRYGIYFDSGEQYAMDYKFLIEVFRIAKVKKIDQILGSFMSHPDAKTFGRISDDLCNNDQQNVIKKILPMLSVRERIAMKYWQIRIARYNARSL